MFSGGSRYRTSSTPRRCRQSCNPVLHCCAAASPVLLQPNASRIGGFVGGKLATRSAADLSPYNSLDAEINYRLVRMEHPQPYGPRRNRHRRPIYQRAQGYVNGLLSCWQHFMDDLLVFIVFSPMIRASDPRRFHLGEKQSLSFSASS
jgi:hypothetical protein